MEQVRKYGKPPFRIALLHGGPGAAGEMAPVARDLSESCSVLEPLQCARSIEGQIAELRGCVERFGDCPLTLVGFSWGAWLAMLFAAAHPSLVGKVILIGCPPLEQHYVPAIADTRLGRLGEAERHEARSLIDAVERNSSGVDQAAFARLGELFSKADAVDPLGGESGPIASDVGLFQAIWREAAELRRSGELLERAAQVRCPVLALHGDSDPHPADGVRLPLARTLTDFRFVSLKSCGHRPWDERKARLEFFRLLREETGLAR